MRSRSPRGQNLVLFALTLLLLSLMVLVTLQIGMRTHERVEAQMVADAAAYSEAVTTARTYNMVAVMNRARAAHFVALMGTQSLISWSGVLYGGASAMAGALDGCPGGAALAAQVRANAVDPAWEMFDALAGEQARQQQAAQGLRGATQAFYQAKLIDEQLANQQLAQRIARLANPELNAPAAGAAKSMAEVEPNCTTGATCLSGDGIGWMSAVMGSRGWGFTTSRANAVAVGAAGLLASITNTGGGGSGWGADPWYGTPSTSGGPPAEAAQRNLTMQGRASWAEDHGGSVTITVGGCTQTAALQGGYVMSSAMEVDTDAHSYAGDAPGWGGGPPVSQESANSGSYPRHTLGSCPPSTPGCPAVFGGMLSFNRSHLGSPGNDFGQPKHYAMLERDYRTRTFSDPWNLLFNFQFATSGSGTTFDNGNRNGAFRSPAGADLSRQVALGAGLAYYHRPSINGGGGYQEPPNLYNPFWRATLVANDRDVGNRLGAAGYPEARAAYLGLIGAGYQGAP